MQMLLGFVGAAQTVPDLCPTVFLGLPYLKQQERKFEKKGTRLEVLSQNVYNIVD